MPNMRLQFPTSYFYKGADGKWLETSETTTAEINRQLQGRGLIQTGGRELYPQFEPPENLTETATAWRINPDGTPRARWYWQVSDHTQAHGKRCIQLDGNKCARKTIAKLQFDQRTKRWILSQMPGKATDAEARRLDGITGVGD